MYIFNASSALRGIEPLSSVHSNSINCVNQCYDILDGVVFAKRD